MLDRRATETEFTAAPDADPALVEHEHALLPMANRFSGGVRAVRRFVAEQAARLGRLPHRPLHVLDLGSGSCDIPIAVSRWAASREIDVRFTCVERNEVAIRRARQRVADSGEPGITVVHGDATSLHIDDTFDCATASLLVHHFSDEQIVAMVEQLRGRVSGALLINDLRRSPVALMMASLATLGLDRRLRHDTLLSIRRGFRPDELRQLLQRVGRVRVSVRPAWLFRVLAVVEFSPAY